MSAPDVMFAIHIEPEPDGPEGSFASGDDEADKRMCDDIRRRAHHGDVWAWCIVTVTASVVVDGIKFTGTDSLGGCSYESEEDFVGDGTDGYYPDMCNQARLDLLANLRAAVAHGEVASKVLAALS